MSSTENNYIYIGGGSCSHHPDPIHVELNPTGQPLLTLTDINMNRGAKQVLQDINQTIYKGDFIAITGPNGGGKTTLLRIILGLLKPTAGTVNHHGQKPTVGYLPQKNLIDSQFPLTVYEVVKSGLLGNKKLTKQQRHNLTLQTVQNIELPDHIDNPIGALSGGQLQRTLLGRAIISNPDLLVLDEPLSYIDKHFEAHIYRLLAAYAPHCTTLLVSHEMTTIDAMANRHWLVDKKITECRASHHGIKTDCNTY